MYDLDPYEIAQALRLQLRRVDERILQIQLMPVKSPDDRPIDLFRLSKSRETLLDLITALEE